MKPLRRTTVSTKLTTVEWAEIQAALGPMTGDALRHFLLGHARAHSLDEALIAESKMLRTTVLSALELLSTGRVVTPAIFRTLVATQDAEMPARVSTTVAALGELTGRYHDE
jgi:hypothetical protein